MWLGRGHDSGSGSQRWRRGGRLGEASQVCRAVGGTPFEPTVASARRRCETKNFTGWPATTGLLVLAWHPVPLYSTPAV